MSKEKQIDQMAKDLCLARFCSLEEWNECKQTGAEYCYKGMNLAKDLYRRGYRKQSEVIDEFAKRLLDAFPESNRDNRCPAIYYDDYRYIIEELAEKMKGGAE